MISRRNIRVKVMQTLYSIDSMSGETQTGEPEAILSKKIDQSRHLFSYLVYFITEIARFAETDARQKASKHLPTATDLQVNTKISGNELLWKILEDNSFKQVIKEGKFEHLIDQDLLKRIYNDLVQSEFYQEYIEEQSREKKSEKKILDFIFTDLLLPNEHFVLHLEEHFMNWDDDAELMQTLVLNYFNKPVPNSFGSILTKEKADFANDLLRTVLDKQSFTLDLIKPKLKNWDADRIASNGCV